MSNSDDEKIKSSDILYGSALVIAAIALLTNSIAILKHAEIIVEGIGFQILKWTAIVEGVVTATALTGAAVVNLSTKVDNIKYDLDRRIKTLNLAINKILANTGADLLSLVTGLLIYFIQEALFPNQSTLLQKIGLTIILTIFLLLSSHLISQKNITYKILGFIFYVTPIPLFMYISDIDMVKFMSFLKVLTLKEIFLLITTLFTILLLIPFSLMRKRESVI